MPKIPARGIDLYYEEYGEGAPILGIHGTPSSALLWAEPAKQLSNHGRCIIYDRRGFFRSERARPFEGLDLDEHVEDAAGLLDALSATPAVVIGRSTGGLIALELARRFPDKVKALVLLEPAMFTVDAEAAAWAQRLRQNVLETASQDHSAAAQAVFREALGNNAWESLPPDLRAVFTAASPAVLAEIKGRGLDLSEEPLDLSSAELAKIDKATLLVSAQDSPEALRRVNDRLASALPHTQKVLVTGGHLINPAHPHVLQFLDDILTSLK